MERKNFVAYMDTDSLFIRLNYFLTSNGIDKKIWDSLLLDTKVEYLLRLSKYIENNINDRMFYETQKVDYMSSVEKEDFSIKFKQEIICDYALHIAPKMYAFHVINKEGFKVDEDEAKGIEIVRSTSPKAFRTSLKALLKKILSGADKSDISSFINNEIGNLNASSPEEVSTNIGVNNLTKYREGEFGFKKGTPSHVKGAINYMMLIKQLNLSHKYEPIREGDKCKFCYVKSNKWGIEGVSYFSWPEEFKDHGIIPDYAKQIEKYYLAKINILMSPLDIDFTVKANSEDDFF